MACFCGCVFELCFSEVLGEAGRGFLLARASAWPALKPRASLCTLPECCRKLLWYLVSLSVSRVNMFWSFLLFTHQHINPASLLFKCYSAIPGDQLLYHSPPSLQHLCHPAWPWLPETAIFESHHDLTTSTHQPFLLCSINSPFKSASYFCFNSKTLNGPMSNTECMSLCTVRLQMCQQLRKMNIDR